jgi:hypothetical protein
MNGSLRLLALVLVVGVPAAALAQSHGGGGQASGGGGGHVSSGGGGHVSSGGGRVSAPSMPAAPPAQSPHGFSFPHETNVQPIPPQHPVTLPGPPGTSANRTPTTYTHAPFNGNRTGGPYYGQFHGAVIYNPHRWWGWGWNHGVPWYPAPIYWGGGFWGPFAISGLTVGFLFGSIIDYQNQVIYPSYQIVPSSPGAELLQNYGLQQTECGPPNLVVIWGPGDSVICAYPNNLVGPGNYEVDPTTLTLVSRASA